MSDSLLEHLSTLNDLVQDVIWENNRLKAQLNRAATAEQTQGPNRPNRPKLTRDEVLSVRDWKRAGFSQAEIAREFDINPATVSRIIAGIYHR